MKSWVALPLALLVFVCNPANGAAPADPRVTLHVNQVALERTGPKSAIVQYTGPERSGRFTVLKDETPVQSGQLVALPEFTEWGGGTKYFKADFSALAVSGSYRLMVAMGRETATSPPFTVADDAMFVTTASALLDYFRANRYTNPADRRIRVFDSDRYVDVWGGWKDAGGDNGKYLSHLSYANFFNPQQAALVVWALGAAYASATALFDKQGLTARVIEEAFWGADYLHRLLDQQGYFYMTVFDRWAEPGAERMVTAYVGIDGVYTKDYQAAFREGGGVAIAALARASTLTHPGGVHGEFSTAQYLQDAERAFAHLQQHNREYCDNGVENIIDDYTALLAATELYRATRKDVYLQAARVRADHLNARLTKNGWFVSDGGSRPYYHAVEAGFPIVSLVYSSASSRSPNERGRRRIRFVGPSITSSRSIAKWRTRTTMRGRNSRSTGMPSSARGHSTVSSFRTPTKAATGGKARARDSLRLQPRPYSAAGPSGATRQVRSPSLRPSPSLRRISSTGRSAAIRSTCVCCMALASAIRHRPSARATWSEAVSRTASPASR